MLTSSLARFLLAHLLAHLRAHLRACLLAHSGFDARGDRLQLLNRLAAAVVKHDRQEGHVY